MSSNEVSWWDYFCRYFIPEGHECDMATSGGSRLTSLSWGGILGSSPPHPDQPRDSQHCDSHMTP